MAEQEMMLGVPPGPEPVRREPVEAPEPEAPDAERARGIVKYSRGEEKFVVTMRHNGVAVRRAGKRHKDHKTIDEIVLFVVGQGDLFHNPVDTELAGCLAEIVVAYEQDSPLMKVAVLNAAKILGEKFPKQLEIARS